MSPVVAERASGCSPIDQPTPANLACDRPRIVVDYSAEDEWRSAKDAATAVRVPRQA
jgi:hypothetical protein